MTSRVRVGLFASLLLASLASGLGAQTLPGPKINCSPAYNFDPWDPNDGPLISYSVIDHTPSWKTQLAYNQVDLLVPEPIPFSISATDTDVMRVYCNGNCYPRILPGDVHVDRWWIEAPQGTPTGHFVTAWNQQVQEVHDQDMVLYLPPRAIQFDTQYQIQIFAEVSDTHSGGWEEAPTVIEFTVELSRHAGDPVSDSYYDVSASFSDLTSPSLPLPACVADDPGCCVLDNEASEVGPLLYAEIEESKYPAYGMLTGEMRTLTVTAEDLDAFWFECGLFPDCSISHPDPLPEHPDRLVFDWSISSGGGEILHEDPYSNTIVYQASDDPGPVTLSVLVSDGHVPGELGFMDEPMWLSVTFQVYRMSWIDQTEDTVITYDDEGNHPLLDRRYLVDRPTNGSEDPYNAVKNRGLMVSNTEHWSNFNGTSFPLKFQYGSTSGPVPGPGSPPLPNVDTLTYRGELLTQPNPYDELPQDWDYSMHLLHSRMSLEGDLWVEDHPDNRYYHLDKIDGAADGVPNAFRTEDWRLVSNANQGAHSATGSVYDDDLPPNQNPVDEHDDPTIEVQLGDWMALELKARHPMVNGGLWHRVSVIELPVARPWAEAFEPGAQGEQALWPRTIVEAAMKFYTARDSVQWEHHSDANPYHAGENWTSDAGEGDGTQVIERMVARASEDWAQAGVQFRFQDHVDEPPLKNHVWVGGPPGPSGADLNVSGNLGFDVEIGGTKKSFNVPIQGHMNSFEVCAAIYNALRDSTTGHPNLLGHWYHLSDWTMLLASGGGSSVPNFLDPGLGTVLVLDPGAHDVVFSNWNRPSGLEVDQIEALYEVQTASGKTFIRIFDTMCFMFNYRDDFYVGPPNNGYVDVFIENVDGYAIAVEELPNGSFEFHGIAWGFTVYAPGTVYPPGSWISLSLPSGDTYDHRDPSCATLGHELGHYLGNLKHVDEDPLIDNAHTFNLMTAGDDANPLVGEDPKGSKRLMPHQIVASRQHPELARIRVGIPPVPPLQ